MSTQEKTAPSHGGFAQSLDSFFQISKRGSTISHEIRGGFVTFFAMAYILVVNPAILGNAVPKDGSITTQGIAAGTALVAGVMTILMGVVANYPLALAAGLGLNAVVAFTLVLGAGLSYGEAMGSSPRKVSSSSCWSSRASVRLFSARFPRPSRPPSPLAWVSSWPSSAS